MTTAQPVYRCGTCRDTRIVSGVVSFPGVVWIGDETCPDCPVDSEQPEHEQQPKEDCQ